MPGSKTRESEARSEDSGAKVKIIDETSLTCTCDHQPWACQACDFEGWVGRGAPGGAALSEKEVVIRKRFKKTPGDGDWRLEERERREENEEDLRTSDFDPNNGWLERDPETTQTFKRTDQVKGSDVFVLMLESVF